MKVNSGYSLHMQLDFPEPKDPLGPSNSTTCPRTAPKRPPKAPEFVYIGRQQPQTKNKPYLGLLPSWWGKEHCPGDFNNT